MSIGVPERNDSAATLRWIILALVFIGASGMLVDLLLLEHYETVWQWTPLALLVPVIVSVIIVAMRPGRAALRVFQGLMALCVVVGLVGLFLHYRGNVEFELERDPSLRGFSLFWETIRGATPALAPGALSQLGLLGLAYAFRHPALRATTGRATGADPVTKEIR